MLCTRSADKMIKTMDYDRRLPRRMLSAWVPHPRPLGAPNITHGRSIRKALDKFHIDHTIWTELAADRLTTALHGPRPSGSAGLPLGDPPGLPYARVCSPPQRCGLRPRLRV
jgi:hypothetical protein